MNEGLKGQIEDYEKRLREAAGTADVIEGKPLGPWPKYFLVGDYPNTRDVITRQPFSGTMRDVLLRAYTTLEAKYRAQYGELYVTYLWKTIVPPNEMTEKELIEKWLPLCQLEFALSGCERVVALGPVARTYAAQIAERPAGIQQNRPSLVDRIRMALQVLKA